jgi:hypothetical protein
MTLEFKYLGEFEFIFETNQGYESGLQEGAFGEKKRSPRSLASLLLK